MARPIRSGADRDRTGDPLLAKQVLSQLSYRPEVSNSAQDSPALTAAEPQGSIGRVSDPVRAAAALQFSAAHHNPEGSAVRELPADDALMTAVHG
jgi:hypothetical protein